MTFLINYFKAYKMYLNINILGINLGINILGIN